MDDPADDPPVVHTRLAPRVSRKKRFKPRELLLAQPETISIHEWSPFGDLESRNAPIGNPLYGSRAYDLVTACGFNPAPCPSRVFASSVNAVLWPAYVVLRMQ